MRKESGKGRKIGEDREWWKRLKRKMRKRKYKKKEGEKEEMVEIERNREGKRESESFLNQK